MVKKLFQNRDTVIGTIGVALFVLFVSGFFILKSDRAQADEGAIEFEAVETAVEEVTTNSGCSVYVPQGTDWSVERLRALAHQYGCEINQFFFGEDS